MDTYPKPTARAWDDFSQYVPLLLAAIDAELMRDAVWTEVDRDDALAYMDDLKTFILELEDLMTSLMPTEVIITPATAFPVLLKSVAAGETCDEILVTVDSAWDAGSLTIGDATAPERLMPSGATNLAITGLQSQRSPQYQYPAATDIFIYLTGSPTTGSARVTLYTYAA